MLEKHAGDDALVLRLASPSELTHLTIIMLSVQHHFFSVSRYTLMDEGDRRRNWRAHIQAGILFLLQILNYCRGLSDKPAYHGNEFRALLNKLRDKDLLRPGAWCRD